MFVNGEYAMPRRLVTALFCLLSVNVFTFAAPLTSTAYAAPLAQASGAERMFALAQRHHVAAGCQPWRRDPRLDRAAQLHAQELARTRRISHVGRNGSRVRDRLRNQGYPANRATESIALYATPEQSVRFWMNEGPRGPHRRNITWCQYTDAGVGVAYDARGVAYWVMDYANRSGK